jgi:putative aldouronate transport system substrate-binding protein
VFLPESWAMSSTEVTTAQESGQVAIDVGSQATFPDGPGSLLSTIRQKTPQAVFGYLPVFGWNGGLGLYHAPTGTTNAFGLSRSLEGNDKKIDLILKLMDFLAAPFGTKEQFFTDYGLEGIDYKIVDGGPSVTTTGTAQTAAILGLSQLNPVTFTAGSSAESVRTYWEAQRSNLPIITTDAGAPLFSATWLSAGLGLLTNAANEALDVVLGRRPMSYLDTIVGDFMAGGGAQVKKDYEEEYRSLGRAALARLNPKGGTV